MRSLKERWGITSNLQLLLILLTFAITGSISARLATPFCEWLGFNFSQWNIFFVWCVKLVVILPVYQVTLLLVGGLLGQFRFFWAFEKKFLKRIIKSK